MRGGRDPLSVAWNAPAETGTAGFVKAFACGSVDSVVGAKGGYAWNFLDMTMINHPNSKASKVFEDSLVGVKRVVLDKDQVNCAL